jgi:hypothetical protein
MPEVNQTNADPNSAQKPNSNPFKAAYALFKRLPIGLRRIIWADLGAVAIVVLISIFHPNLATRVKFATDGILNLLIVLIIAVQAYIYVRQWDVMEQNLERTDDVIDQMKCQLSAMEAQNTITQQNFTMQAAINDPRLRIARVTVEDFDPGKKPIFIVKIINDGLIPAQNVDFEMRVQLGVDKEESSSDMFDVPAKDTEVQHLVSHGVLDEQTISGFNTDVPLTVRGRMRYFPHFNESPQTFCYQYYPWKGDRPKEIPQFVRCTRRGTVDIGLHVSGGRFEITDTPIALRLDKATPEKTEAEREGEPESKEDEG